MIDITLDNACLRFLKKYYFLSFCLIGGIIGYNFAFRNYIIPLVILLSAVFFLPVLYLFLISFFLIQFPTLNCLKLFQLGSLDIYLWDVLISFLMVRIFIGAFILKVKRLSSPLNKYILLLFAWGLFSISFNLYLGPEHIKITLTSFARVIFAMSFFFFAIYCFDSEEKINKFIKLVVFLMVFQVILAIVQRVGSEEGFFLPMKIFSPVKGAFGSIDFRSAGTLGSATLFAEELLLFSFIVPYFLFQRQQNKYSGLGLACFSILGVILSGSKGSYLGLLIFFAILCIEFKNKKFLWFYY